MIWFAKRVATACILVWVVASVVFTAITFVPGDPALMLLSQGGGAPTDEAVKALRAELGIDRPFLTQYSERMTALMSGDLGNSLQDGTDVAGEIARRLPRTIELILAATVIATLVGIPAGAVAAARRDGLFDRAMLGLTAVSLAAPVFVIGSLAILLFAQTLRLVPAGGFISFAANPSQHVALLLMPAATIACGLTASVFRMTRASVLEVIQRDYVRTARAKGLSTARVFFRHIVRTAIGPVITVVSLNMGALLGGSVLVEYVFNWPGLSGLLVEAVNARDYPMVVGVVFIIAAVFVVLNLLVDVIYALLDPRVLQA